ncbi:hypothetical protein [Aquabacterium sp. OR-4]|uniref:hypothetical protein n=1 Tax=Aquabacterium sp. OR-4 TaxID=2978127 RepID=UPI0028C72273|nr:hypothetical protein [Aquabacterium sp. OR-4]MDT7835113.1 hypothetical protein [Aquabacterium sp. OR-4]
MPAHPPAPAPRATPQPWSLLLGRQPLIRRQVRGVLLASGLYLLYGAITLAQAALGLMPWPLAWALLAGSLALNAVFYVAVRSAAVAHGSDPGLARTQLTVGLGCLCVGYAAAGPAGSATLLVMVSHIAYAAFTMTPRQVWRLVAGCLAGLLLTMLACHLAWPARFPVALQASALMFALLAVPLIALLSQQVAQMRLTLERQRIALQAAHAQRA